MRLLPATDADQPWALALQREAFLDLVTRTHGGWNDTLLAQCADAWNVDHTRIVEVNGARVGWLRVEHRADRDWLDLVVLGRRGEGIGAAVVGVLQREAHDRSVPLWLSVWRANEARRLYARLGFAEHPRDADRVFMVWPHPP